MQEVDCLRRSYRFFAGLSSSALTRDRHPRLRLPDLAIEAAVLLGVEPDRSGEKFTGKCGKRASTSPARPVTREPDKEVKGQIDYMLLAGLSSPSLAPVPGHIDGEYDVFKRGQDFVDLNSVTMNGTEGLRAPERVPGERISTQAFNPLGQFFCALLDISKQRIVVGGEGAFLSNPISGSCTRDGLAKPSHRFVRCGDVSEFQQIPCLFFGQNSCPGGLGHRCNRCGPLICGSPCEGIIVSLLLE